jgi:hypothetical protein
MVFWFSTYSDKKAADVERFNRTLNEKMYRYFTAKETNKWFDILGDLVNGYNYSSFILYTSLNYTQDLETHEEKWGNKLN